MSSSGLIYAVIVGAWAAYLVPMWLRRQDELNEARPTERFSTAIRLLSGRAGMERRYAKELREREAWRSGDGRSATDVDPDAETEHLSSVDVRAFAAPPDRTEARLAVPPHSHVPAHGSTHGHAPADRPDRLDRTGHAPANASGGPASAADSAAPPAPAAARPARRRTPPRGNAAAERARRSRVLARRRRTTVILFLAFTLGAIVAAVGGLAFLWVPGIPAILLSAYIVHLRHQERRRFVYVMDRRRAEAAAQRLRENRPRRQPAPDQEDEPEARHRHDPDPEPAPALSPQEAGRRALVEQTDHAEWVDQQRERGPARGDSWDPVPVPLPTYVTAPVAPRATGGVDISDPETWSAARSSVAEPTPPPATRKNPNPSATPPRRPRDHGRTPLFDQYADEDRPRAANE
ncbi:gephyrin-like molybdotransferase receptor GlpR [Streptomyces sp. NPDC047928]|uniref:divisome protein SepX/GlpR n=1 Tax=unclassified Streptomyces TaxID=2593676 RepID=UPI00371DB32F